MIRVARILGLAVATAFGSQTVSAQSREAEEAKVYSAAFDFLFGQYRGEAPRPIIVMDTTSPDAGSVAYKGNVQQPHNTQIDKEAVEDFEARNRRQSHISKSAFSYRLPIVLLSLPEYFRLDTAGRKILRNRPYVVTPEPGNFMDALVVKFPHTWGLTGVSRIGLNASRTQALVMVTHTCGYCWHSETLVLRKVGGAWVLQERIPLQNSDGFGPGETRYLGSDAQFLPRLRKTQDSTRRAIADSITRDKLPRRIRGIAVNSTTNRPLPHAQVFLQHHGIVDTPEELKRSETLLRTTADSVGRFEFLNPPVGVTTLILECPGSTFSKSIGLDMRVTFMRQGGDTAVDLVAPDITPCWGPRRIHRVSTGTIESAEVRDSPMPDAEEALVYRAVLSTILQPFENERRRLGIRYQTVAPCEHVRTCGAPQLPRLQFLGVVDSFTITDFIKKGANHLAFRSDFVRSIDADPLTPEDLTFLRQQEETRRRVSPNREPATDSFWDAFESAYPRRVGIASFTQIGFNRLHSQALVEVTLDQRGWMDKPELLLLSSSKGTWRIVRRHIEAERTSGIIAQRTSGTMAQGKCVPSTGVFTVPQRQLQNIEGLYQFSFVTTTGSMDLPGFTLLLVPDSVLRSEARALRSYPGRSPAMGDPFPSSFGVPGFELLNQKGQRDEGTEFGLRLFSGRIPFERFKPSFTPDAVIGKGEDMEILGVWPNGFGGSWVENDFFHISRSGIDTAPRAGGYFCAEKIEDYRSEMRK